MTLHGAIPKGNKDLFERGEKAIEIHSGGENRKIPEADDEPRKRLSYGVHYNISS